MFIVFLRFYAAYCQKIYAPNRECILYIKVQAIFFHMGLGGGGVQCNGITLDFLS
ncbi:hypothetical protein [Helicobacter bilis]|uniref:hypothetical protein n=1 Tax=Helicobacter bilis TaxID=37372 RepID=UPI00248D76B6|nr:hypothetical protein [Helicobacter bilis]